ATLPVRTAPEKSPMESSFYRLRRATLEEVQARIREITRVPGGTSSRIQGRTYESELKRPPQEKRKPPVALGQPERPWSPTPCRVAAPLRWVTVGTPCSTSASSAKTPKESEPASRPGGANPGGSCKRFSPATSAAVPERRRSSGSKASATAFP